MLRWLALARMRPPREIEQRRTAVGTSSKYTYQTMHCTVAGAGGEGEGTNTTAIIVGLLHRPVPPPAPPPDRALPSPQQQGVQGPTAPYTVQRWVLSLLQGSRGPKRFEIL